MEAVKKQSNNFAADVRITSKRTRAIKEKLIAYSFISPWLLGFLAFIIGPMLASIYFSFTNYDLLSSPKWVGARNYIKMFTDDTRFLTAVGVTFKFVIFSVPLRLIFALCIALLFNRKRRGVGFYRTVYYMPSIIGGSVAVAVMWRQLFGQEGAVNQVLAWFGIAGESWIGSYTYAIWTLVLLAVWQFGSPMLIFLAGLKQIPGELYEASEVDGATRFVKFFRITLPMLSPVIFFNLVMQTVDAFKAFTQSFLVTQGGPLDSTLFYAVYLYQKAFTNFEMGYASAMAWVMLLIIGVFTTLIFRSSSMWVYYESEGGK